MSSSVWSINSCCVRSSIAAVLIAIGSVTFAADDKTPRDWREAGHFAAPEARQAAAADAENVYAISSTEVAKYDRAGKLLAHSKGEASHLNSGFLHDGKLYLAHSNYPTKPEQSEIKVLDPATMELKTWLDFGASDGSLTWCVRDADGVWWCNFAFYGADNAESYVAKFDDWHEVARWTYPASVVKHFGTKSSSGGIWHQGKLLVTGHDEREIYVLGLPTDASDHVLHHVGTVKAPFTGQGIAADPATGGLIGIDRAKRRVIFAE